MKRNMSNGHGIAERRNDSGVGAPRDEDEPIAGHDRWTRRIGERPGRSTCVRQAPCLAVGKQNAPRKGSTGIGRRRKRDAYEIGNAGLRPRLHWIHDDQEVAVVELVDGVGKGLKARIQLDVKGCKLDAVEMNSDDFALGKWRSLHVERQVGDRYVARLEEVDVALVGIEQDDPCVVSGSAKNQVLPVDKLQA